MIIFMGLLPVLQFVCVFSGTGRAEPVPIEVKADRGGLGKAAEAKRKAAEMQAMRSSMAAKRQRYEVKQKESFLQQMSSRFASKAVEKDLRTSQKACHQLDTQSVSLPVQRGAVYIREMWDGWLNIF